MAGAWTCAKCNHVVPDGRPRCMYCGATRDGANVAPVAVPKRPDGARAESRTAVGAFLARHETTIDVTLLVLALPIATLALVTSFLFTFVARFMRRG